MPGACQYLHKAAFFVKPFQQFVVDVLADHTIYSALPARQAETAQSKIGLYQDLKNPICTRWRVAGKSFTNGGPVIRSCHGQDSQESQGSESTKTRASASEYLRGDSRWLCQIASAKGTSPRHRISSGQSRSSVNTPVILLNNLPYFAGIILQQQCFV